MSKDDDVLVPTDKWIVRDDEELPKGYTGNTFHGVPVETVTKEVEKRPSPFTEGEFRSEEKRKNSIYHPPGKVKMRSKKERNGPVMQKTHEVNISNMRNNITTAIKEGSFVNLLCAILASRPVNEYVSLEKIVEICRDPKIGSYQLRGGIGKLKKSDLKEVLDIRRMDIGGKPKTVYALTPSALETPYKELLSLANSTTNKTPSTSTNKQPLKSSDEGTTIGVGEIIGTNPLKISFKGTIWSLPIDLSIVIER